MQRVAAIIPAAGSGTRLGGEVPKALRLLAGKPLVRRAVDALAAHPGISRIVVAAPPTQLDALRELLGPDVLIVPGGSDRQASVAAGLAAIGPECDIVLVHDAARPLVPAAVIARVIDAVAGGADAAVPGLPVVDTVKRVDEHDFVEETPPRRLLRAVQTPQGFRREVLVAAHASAHPDRPATDDAALAEAAGFRVQVVPGDPAALKITTPDDLRRAEALLGEGRLRIPRVGIGVDVHRYGSDRVLMLAGLAWPGEPGLDGHSDADVACHAAVDAIFNAAGLGDLGAHFGTAEPQWAGASGLVLLAEAVARTQAAGWVVGNVGIQVIGNRPRLAGRRDEAQSSLSEVLGAPAGLSATTTDGLGLTGRAEGIAAIATALVMPDG